MKKNPLVETVTRNRCVPTGIAADAQFGCSSCPVALDRVKLAPTSVFRQPFGMVVIKRGIYFSIENIEAMTSCWYGAMKMGRADGYGG